MQLRPFFFALASIASFFFFFTPSASAAETVEQTPSSGRDGHLTGLEIMLRPSLGGVGGASPLRAAPGVAAPSGVPTLLTGASPYGTSFGGGAQLGFRFHPLVSAGLRGDLGSVSTSAVNDGTKDLSRSWQSAGLYVRAYPLALSSNLRRYVDPWLSLGITYVHDGQSFGKPAQTNTGTSVDAKWQLDTHSIGAPLAIGFDLRVTPALSVGPSFEYVVMNPIAGCAKQTAAGFQANRMCTDNDAGTSALVADASGAWNLGLGIRLTPF